MPSIDMAERKWFIKTTAAIRTKWLRMVKSSESLDAFVKGIADFLGVSEGVVRNSLPVKNWAEFQANAERYIDIMLTKIRRAYESKKWSRKLRAAFTGSE